jgi:hypothetical protein
MILCSFYASYFIPHMIIWLSDCRIPLYLSTSLPLYLSTSIPLYLSTSIPLYLYTSLPLYIMYTPIGAGAFAIPLCIIPIKPTPSIWNTPIKPTLYGIWHRCWCFCGTQRTGPIASTRCASTRRCVYSIVCCMVYSVVWCMVYGVWCMVYMTYSSTSVDIHDTSADRWHTHIHTYTHTHIHTYTHTHTWHAGHTWAAASARRVPILRWHYLTMLYVVCLLMLISYAILYYCLLINISYTISVFLSHYSGRSFEEVVRGEIEQLQVDHPYLSIYLSIYL